MTPEPETEAPTPAEGRRDRRRRTAFLWWLAIGAIFIAGRFTPFKPVQQFFGSFRWLTEQSLRLAEDLFESYGYLTVFLAPLLENTIFLGALLPGTLVMLLAGLGAHDGLINLWPAIPLGILGAWIGDTISYGIGRYGWQRLGPESRLVRWAEGMRGPLIEQSSWIVVMYHFAGYTRLVGPAASGFIRMPFGRWVVLDYFGSALWVIAYMMGGYLLGVFGLSLEASDSNVRVFEIILFVLAMVAIVVVVNRSQKRGGRKEEAPSTDSLEPSKDGHRPAEPGTAEGPDHEATRERVD
jgi:membrane protein DedA with SNARE-associated domain